MTPRKAAKLVGCSTHHIRLCIRAGKIKARTVPTENNQHGYRYEISQREAERFRDAPTKPCGWPRGKSRKPKE